MISPVTGFFFLIVIAGHLPVPAAGPADLRRSQLVEANIIATHAWEMLLADTVEKTPALLEDYQKGPFPGFRLEAFTRPELHALVEHQAALLNADSIQLLAWVKGKSSTFDPKTDLEPLLSARITLSDSLPVTVMTAYLKSKTKKPAAEVRAVANLFQMTLEEDRDANTLQQLMAFYHRLGLPVYLKPLGLPNTEDALLAMGKVLAPKTSHCPFGTDEKKWQIHGVALASWAEKMLHIRDDVVIARELLKEPEIKTLLPKIKALPAEKIAIIGHSYTMHVHWASPSSFTQITAALFNLENPRVEIRHWTKGGLNAATAKERFYTDVLAWKPAKVFLVVSTGRAGDSAAFVEMAKGFAAAGSEVYTFDRLGVRTENKPGAVDQARVLAQAAGVKIIEVGKIIDASPGADKFYCLDGRHMREPYHRLLAKELVKVLTGARW